MALRLVPALLLLVTGLAAEDAAPPAPAAAPVPAPRGEPPATTGNINAFIGGKALDEDDWEPVEGHAAFGILFDIKPRGWPIALAVHAISTVGGDEDEDTDVETVATTSELQVGVKWIFNEGSEGPFRAWVGAGAALVSAAMEIDPPDAEDEDDDDVGFGAWAGAGVYWTIARHINVGPVVQYSWAEVELFGEDVQAGGWLGGLLVGFHW